ncbi:MAG: tesA, partial [Candidatus Solibacter sp.]|nr:tesA [Candidatus Solibacter sp.]
ASGKLDGVVIEASAKADAVEQFAGPGTAASIASSEFHGQEDILFGSQSREQVVGLKDEADFASTELRHLIFAEIGDIFAVEDDLSTGGRIEAGEQAEQRTFAAARWAHDCRELTAGDFEVDAFEDFDPVRSGIDGLGESANLDQPTIMAFR